MKSQAKISIYPLKKKSLSEPINEFCGILKDSDLSVRTNSMGTIVTGESEEIFKAVHKAYGRLSQRYNLVMDFKISNTCPEQKETDYG